MEPNFYQVLTRRPTSCLAHPPLPTLILSPLIRSGGRRSARSQDLSRPKQPTNHMAKPRSPLYVMGAGFLATTAGGTTVTVASADHSVLMQGNAPANALASQGSLVHDDR